MPNNRNNKLPNEVWTPFRNDTKRGLIDHLPNEVINNLEYNHIEIIQYDQNTGDGIASSLFRFNATQRQINNLPPYEPPVVPPGGGGNMNDLEQRVTNLEIGLQQTNANVRELQVRMDNLEVRMDKLEVWMDKLEVRMDRLEERMDKLEVRMEKIETAVEEIKVEQVATNMRLGNIENLLQQLLNK